MNEKPRNISVPAAWHCSSPGGGGGSGGGGGRKRPDDDIPAANFGTIPKLRKVVRPPRRGRRRGTAASGYF